MVSRNHLATLEESVGVTSCHSGPKKAIISTAILEMLALSGWEMIKSCAADILFHSKSSEADTGHITQHIGHGQTGDRGMNFQCEFSSGEGRTQCAGTTLFLFCCFSVRPAVHKTPVNLKYFGYRCAYDPSASRESQKGDTVKQTAKQNVNKNQKDFSLMPQTPLLNNSHTT